MTDSTTSHFKDIKIEHNLNEYFFNPDLHLEIDYRERLRTKT